MNAELLYTSAPSGLKQGSRGFCTVLSTAGMPINLASKLESLSGYRHVYPSGTPDANKNPVGFSHLRFSLGGRMVSVISRISDYGLDYSQRTNKLAHHIVVDSPLPPSGPAALLLQTGVMRDAWDGRCATVPPPALPIMEVPPRVCREWESMTGDAGWGGVVANTWLRPQPKPLFIVFSEDQAPRLLSLIAESIALLPVRQRWQATFGTYVTNLPPDVDCKVRCVIAGSEEARMASARGSVINLTTPLGPAVDSDATQAAREGSSIGGSAVRTPVLPADVETSESEESPSAIPPEYEEFEFDEDKPFGDVSAHSPPDVRYAGTRYKTPSRTTATTKPKFFTYRRVLTAAICLLLSLLGIAGYGIYRSTKQMSEVVREVKKDGKPPEQDPKDNKESDNRDPTKEQTPPPSPPPPPPISAADFSIALIAPNITRDDGSVVDLSVESAGFDVVAKLEKKRDLPPEWDDLNTKWSWTRKLPDEKSFRVINGELSERLKITGKERLNTEFRVIAIVSSQSGESLQRIESKIIRVAKIPPPPPPAYKPDDFEIDTRFVLKGNEDGQEIEIPLETGVRGAVAKGMIKPKIGVDPGNYETTWSWFVKQPNIPPTVDWKPIEDAKGDILPITKDFAPNSEIRCEATLKFESGDLFVVKSREPPLKISGVLTATIDLREVIKSTSIRDLKFPIEIPATLEAITRNESREDRFTAFGLKTQLDAKSGRRIVNPTFRNVRNFASDADLRMLEDLENKLKIFQKTHKEIRKKIDALQAVCENKGKDVLWSRDITKIIKEKENEGFTDLTVALVPSVRKAEEAIEKYRFYVSDGTFSPKDEEEFEKYASEKIWITTSPSGVSNVKDFLVALREFMNFWNEKAGSLLELGGTPKKVYDSLLTEIEDYENDQINLLRDSVILETNETTFVVNSRSKTSDDDSGLGRKERELATFGMTIILKVISGVRTGNPHTEASGPSVQMDSPDKAIRGNSDKRKR